MPENNIPDNSEKTDIRSLTREELERAVTDLGEKRFRADQIFDWLHKKCVVGFSQMKNIPAGTVEKLKSAYSFDSVEVQECFESEIDGTRKYLLRLYDGNIIECVLMKYEYGNSICVSSQVGCRMGCRFCASTMEGLERNLTAGEMAGEVYAVSRDTGEKISHIVIMGSGEPFDNYDEVLRFIKNITDEKGQNLSGRNITVSTCGIVDGIKKLADEKLQLTLAISLHATTDEKRKKIMPIANRYTIDQILSACRYYFDKTGRRITFEYSLISGVNDSDEDASQLSGIAGKINAHVNLIPVNPVSGRDYVQTARSGVLAFKNKLEKNHINVTIRREMGRDINGACGQLRRSYITSHKGEDQC